MFAAEVLALQLPTQAQLLRFKKTQSDNMKQIFMGALCLKNPNVVGVFYVRNVARGNS